MAIKGYLCPVIMYIVVHCLAIEVTLYHKPILVCLRCMSIHC